MSDNLNLQPIQEQLSSGGHILVLMGNHVTVDHVASATALYLALKEQGKDVSIASPAEMRAEFSRLVGLDEISNSISNRDLVIGFENYEFSSIEKVSHNQGSENHFELIIQPKIGKKAPDPKQVNFSFRGADANLIFLVGVNRLEDLGDLYESERNLFTKATTVSFNRRQNSGYTSISVIDQSASSFAEIVADFLAQLGYKAKDDVATNLLSGIDFATNRFQNPMISANAFTVAGELMKNGAKRQPPRPSSAGSNQGGFMPFVPPSSTNKPPTSQNNQQSNQNNNQQATNTGKSENPPQDWLQPKIYKGSTRV